MGALTELYNTQKALNAQVENFPQGHDALGLVLTALQSEVHEAMAELKPTWCWWKEDSVDWEKLKEELTDCWFFYLSLLQIIDQNFEAFNISDFETSMTKELIPRLREEAKQVLPRAPYIQYQLQVLNVHSTPEGPVNTQRLVVLFAALTAASICADLDFLALQEAHARKALTNLERWNKEDSELYQDLSEQLNETIIQPDNIF